MVQEIEASGSLDVASSFPINLAFLEVTRGGWIWQVRSCACCGLKHVHGGGLLHETPTRWLNHRAACCCASGYIIVDGDPARTAELIERFRVTLPN